VEDTQVEQLLKIYTFLPLDAIARLATLEGADIRAAKEALAFAATRLSHGEGAADEARAASRALFAGGGALGAGVPTVGVPRATFDTGIAIVDLLVMAGLAKSKGEARRLIAQGGAAVDGVAVADPESQLTATALTDGALLLRAGKKRYARIVAE